MKELIEYIARSLVDAPDEVAVLEPEPGLFELKVAADDRGKIIGRKGRTAHAIRTVLAAAAKGGDAPSLDIID